MNPLFTLAGYFISIPARLKGMKFGRNSFIAPGYDFFFEKLRGIKLGNNCAIGKSAWIHTVEHGRITIGDNTKIGRRVTIAAVELVAIGKNCLFSYDVSILDHDHDFRDISIAPLDSKLTSGEKIIIGDDCFIGAHSFILKGVTLGKHCVVGANSVVTKSFSDNCVVAGNPAKVIKSLVN